MRRDSPTSRGCCGAGDAQSRGGGLSGPGSNRAAWGSLGVAPCLLLLLLPARGCLRSQAPAGRGSRRAAGDGVRSGGGTWAGSRSSPKRPSRLPSGESRGSTPRLVGRERSLPRAGERTGERPLQAGLNVRGGGLGSGRPFGALLGHPSRPAAAVERRPLPGRRAGPQQDPTEGWSVLGTPALPLDATARTGFRSRPQRDGGSSLPNSLINSNNSA